MNKQEAIKSVKDYVEYSDPSIIELNIDDTIYSKMVDDMVDIGLFLYSNGEYTFNGDVDIVKLM